MKAPVSPSTTSMARKVRKIADSRTRERKHPPRPLQKPLARPNRARTSPGPKAIMLPQTVAPKLRTATDTNRRRQPRPNHGAGFFPNQKGDSIAEPPFRFLSVVYARS